ncbi:hypothetical protein B9Z19DRAFT_1067602 [Tuber borchii]|uniref:Uncharacterized protein n=1 Tax=Tuber borchii TaxID=42251 RepID=A0A2T6ZIC3_TUBBO|nr:hypothetical protein B9Z19DRAFT_1067602 [Tuber borchii]
MLPFKALREAGGAARNFRFFINEGFEEKKAKIELENKAALTPSSRADRYIRGSSDHSGAQRAALHAESEKRVDKKREAEAERRQPAPEQAENEEITKLAEAEEKTLEAEGPKVAELGAPRLAEEEELAENARLELKGEKAVEAKRLLLAEEPAQKEKAADLERLAEAESQCLDAQRHEEGSAAAKALKERKAIEVERAATVESSSQIFVREQAGFDDIHPCEQSRNGLISDEWEEAMDVMGNRV